MSPPEVDLTTVHPAFLTPDPPFRSRDLRTWKDGDPIPFGYHRTEPMNAVAAADASLFIASYFASLIVGGFCVGERPLCAKPDQEDFLFVPGAGPFLQMLQTGSVGGISTLAVDGVVQLCGIGLLVYGMLSPPKPILELDEPPQSRLTVSTFVTPEVSGLRARSSRGGSGIANVAALTRSRFSAGTR